jgi:hypothetical protein
MLWYCRFRWQPGTRVEDIHRRVVAQHDAGTNHPDRIRGWYNLAGGGAGFLLIESDDPREVTEILQPYMDLVSFDVHVAYELAYDKAVEEFRHELTAAA